MKVQCKEFGNYSGGIEIITENAPHPGQKEALRNRHSAAPLLLMICGRSYGNTHVAIRMEIEVIIYSKSTRPDHKKALKALSFQGFGIM